MFYSSFSFNFLLIPGLLVTLNASMLVIYTYVIVCNSSLDCVFERQLGCRVPVRFLNFPGGKLCVSFFSFCKLSVISVNYQPLSILVHLLICIIGIYSLSYLHLCWRF